MGKLLEAMQNAEDRHPLALEYAEDARYIWPSRWEFLRGELIELEQEVYRLRDELDKYRKFAAQMPFDIE